MNKQLKEEILNKGLQKVEESLKEEMSEIFKSEMLFLRKSINQLTEISQKGMLTTMFKKFSVAITIIACCCDTPKLMEEISTLLIAYFKEKIAPRETSNKKVIITKIFVDSVI